LGIRQPSFLSFFIRAEHPIALSNSRQVNSAAGARCCAAPRETYPPAPHVTGAMDAGGRRRPSAYAARAHALRRSQGVSGPSYTLACRRRRSAGLGPAARGAAGQQAGWPLPGLRRRRRAAGGRLRCCCRQGHARAVRGRWGPAPGRLARVAGPSSVRGRGPRPPLPRAACCRCNARGLEAQPRPRQRRGMTIAAAAAAGDDHQARQPKRPSVPQKEAGEMEGEGEGAGRQVSCMRSFASLAACAWQARSVSVWLCPRRVPAGPARQSHQQG
jgi:hypothetical protein